MAIADYNHLTDAQRYAMAALAQQQAQAMQQQMQQAANSSSWQGPLDDLVTSYNQLAGIAGTWTTDSRGNPLNDLYVTSDGTADIMSAKQYGMSFKIDEAVTRRTKRHCVKFPALNDFGIVYEGEELKGVDLLRLRVANWLGTAVAS